MRAHLKLGGFGLVVVAGVVITALAVSSGAEQAPPVANAALPVATPPAIERTVPAAVNFSTIDDLARTLPRLHI